jgi:hypothetical protein
MATPNEIEKITLGRKQELKFASNTGKIVMKKMWKAVLCSA